MTFSSMNGDQRRAYWRVSKAVQQLQEAVNRNCSDVEYNVRYTKLETAQDVAESLGCYN